MGRVISLIVVLFCLIGATFAAQSFQVSPSEVYVTGEFGGDYSGKINVSNDGNESLVIIVNNNDSTFVLSGVGTIVVSLNETEINLDPGQSASVGYSFNTNTYAGSCVGELLFKDQSGAIERSVIFNVSVEEVRNVSVPSSLDVTVPVNSSKDVVLHVVNTGNVNLTVVPSFSGVPSGVSVAVSSFVVPYNGGKDVTISFSVGNVELGSYSFELALDLGGGVVKKVPVNLEVTENCDFELEGIDEDIVIYGEIDRTVTKTITIKNTGTCTLHDFRFENSDFESSDDDFSDSHLDVSEDNFDLAPGDSRDVRLEIDIPSDANLDVYESTLKVYCDEVNRSYTIKLHVIGGNYEIEIPDNSGDVRDGLLTIIGEPGDYVTDYEFKIENKGDFDVREISFDLDHDLEYETGEYEIPKENVIFSPSSVDLDSGDYEYVTVKVNIPSDAKGGNYYSTIEAYSKDGEKLVSLPLKLKVIGDVYISDIELSEDSVKPGDELEVRVKIKNKGSRIYRNVKVYGSIYDIDYINSDLHESTDSFVLDVGEETTKTLIFDIPEDASDGRKAIEIRVLYDDEEITDIKSFDVVRDKHNVEILSSFIRPKIAECDNSLYTYVKVRNLGISKEDVKFSSEIEGTDIKAESGKVELSVNEELEKSLVLDISNLAPGNYRVINEVTYGNGRYFKRFITNLRVENCTAGEVILHVENESEEITKVPQPNNKINIFGREFDKTTAYLGGGLGVAVIIIGILLFLV